MAVIAPTRLQAVEIEFARCEQLLQPLDYHQHIQIKYSSLQIINKRTQSTIHFFGASREHAGSMRGREFSGLVVIDELKDIDPEVVYSIVLPAASNKQAPILVIGTPSGRTDALSTIFREWQVKENEGNPNYKTFLLPLDKTKHLPEDEIEHLRTTLPPHIFARELQCDLMAQASEVLVGVVEIRGAAERTIPPSQYQNYPIYIGYDVGIRRDRACVAIVQGPKLHDIITLDTDDLNEQCSLVANLCRKHYAAELYVDQSGPGEGPVRTLDTLLHNDRTDVYGVQVGEAAQEKDRFHLVRSEILYRLSVWLKSADIPAQNYQLQRELGAILLEDPSDNRLRVAPKPKIRELLGSSPDMLDSIALCFRNEYQLSQQSGITPMDIESGKVSISDLSNRQVLDLYSEFYREAHQADDTLWKDSIINEENWNQ